MRENIFGIYDFFTVSRYTKGGRNLLQGPIMQITEQLINDCLNIDSKL